MKTVRRLPLIAVLALSACATRHETAAPDWVYAQSLALDASRKVVIRELWLQNIPLPEAIHAINDRIEKSGVRLKLILEQDDGSLLPPSKPTASKQEQLVYLGYTAIGLQDVVRELGQQIGSEAFYSGDSIILKQKKK